MWAELLRFILLALMGSSVQSLETVKLEVSLQQGLEDYLETGQKTDELRLALDVLQLPQLFRRGDEKGLLSGAACLACNVGLDVVIRARRIGAQKETIVNLLEKLCVWLRIESETVCHGVMKTQADTLVYIVDNKADLTSKRMCSTILQGLGCEDHSRQDWVINIPPRKAVQYDIQKTENSEKLKVLQLTDIHYDPEYTIGSNAACDSPLCCLAGTTPAKPADSAGYWGDYRGCDVPWHSFTDSIAHITSQHKDLNYVYFTGDILSHKVWDTDVVGNTKTITKVLHHLKQSFGSVPVYPVLGNHEPHPANLFSSDGVNESKLVTQWVFDLAAEEWQAWLPEETKSSIVRGGYYTVLVKPGFRIVALNSNTCYVYNWWLLFNDVDPYDQLKWLVKTLSDAEENDEAVHILSHIPSGDSTCLHNWSKEYARIINRFAHIITAQFNGHTHFDETMLFFNTTNQSEAINVAFNGGSLTSYADLNPNYKIFDIDSKTLEALDYESWTYNLTDANLKRELSPNWYKLYSFKSAYGVQNLSPYELAALTERMAKEPFLTNQYQRFKYRDADTTLSKVCDDKCHLSNLCYMVTYHPEYTLHCDMLTDIYNYSRQKNVYK